MLSGAVSAQPRVLDDFSDAAQWHAGASDQVKASLHRGARGALCLRYDFAGVSGHALLRRELSLDLPAHYLLRLRLHGSSPANALQLKFVDVSGDNVWWMNRPNYVSPQTSTELTIRQRQIEFAWGPAADRVLRHAAAIELVVASGAGGRGEQCVERLTLSELPAPGPRPPAIVSASPGHWQVDLGERREINGLFLRWAPSAGARGIGERAPLRDFDVQLSDDAQHWRTVRRVHGAGRDLQALWLPPELEARHVRLAFQPPTAAPLDVQVMDPEQWPMRNAALTTLAKALPRGRLPRGFVGEQSYWTLVGVDGGGAHAAVISEDG
ncbi:MAG: discoidin domain-containing protein, partial [Burkholderiales bacterium]